jgi:hypothetical protein
MAEPSDVHAMDPESFRVHVRSFEFWFGAVQGYLEGTCFGQGRRMPPSTRLRATRS